MSMTKRMRHAWRGLMQALTPGPADDFWYGPTGGKTLSGVSVDDQSALTLAAVACASRCLCEGVSQLPLKLYRKYPNGQRFETGYHPAAQAVANCNPQVTPMAFREGRTLHAVNAGNGYAEIERTAEGLPVRLWPIHPSRVKYKLTAGRELYYEVTNPQGPPTPLRASDMLHISGVLSEDGIGGKGIVTLARESIGYGIATERQGSSMMEAPVPAYAITGPKFADKGAKQEFREDWAHVHKHRGQPAILPLNTKIEALSLSAVDLDFLNVRKFNVQDIARWYRIPPHMLADLSGATYNNVEMSGIEFVVYSLIPWLVRWEQALGAKLLTAEERAAGFYFEHNVAGLLRGDTVARFNAYKEAIQNGWLSPNDVRRLENLNPVEGGDNYHMQSQMTTLENIASGANLNKPEPKPADKPQLAYDDSALREQIQELGRWTRQGFRDVASRIDGVNDELTATPIVPEVAEPLALPAPNHEEIKTATRKAFEERLARLVAKECNEVRLAFLGRNDKPRQLHETVTRLEAFYAKHQPLMARELSAVVAACNAAGEEWDADVIAAARVAQSQAALLPIVQAGGTGLDEFLETLKGSSDA